jgi:hypothetical protein
LSVGFAYIKKDGKRDRVFAFETHVGGAKFRARVKADCELRCRDEWKRLEGGAQH